MFNIFTKLKYGLNRLKSELMNEEDYWHVDLPFNEKRQNKSINYHLDFSKKADYPFKLDNNIPIVNINDNDVELVVTIVSYGLGLIDIEAENHKEKLISISNWLQLNQDVNGYWKTNYEDKNYKLPSGWDSGMAQGLAISFLIRLVELGLIDESKGNQMIEQGVKAMLSDNIVVILNKQKVIEEYAGTGTCVLNGFIFSIMALWDYGVYKNDFSFFDEYQNSLKNILKIYKFGLFWTYYDAKGLVASAFYHKLHINMLRWVNSVSPDKLYSHTIKMWKIGLSFRIIFILIKAFQKLFNLSKIDTLNT